MTAYPSAWHAVVDYARACGVEAVFGLPDDDLVPLKAMEHTDLRMVLCRDQRAAAFMAAGHALTSGRTAVCVIGKGPAAANVVGGLVEARCSGAPIVVLASGTAAKARGSGAFQELDQMAMITPVVKWAHRVDHPDRVVPAIERAFLVAENGAPGPVYLELPADLLDTEVVRTRPWRLPRAHRPAPDLEALACSLAALRAARRPIVLAGGGMRHRNASGEIERLAERLGAPIFVTASGRGCVDEEHPLFCGLAGLYAAEETLPLWQECDLVVSLGSRLEETAVTRPGFAAPGTDVLQVNLEPAEISAEWPGPIVIGDGAVTIRAWLSEFPRQAGEWGRRARAAAEAAGERVAAERRRVRDLPGIHIADLLRVMDEVLPERRVLVQENGLQDMWTYFYPHWTCGPRADSIVPSEQTSLGFGAIAAAGVKLAAPGHFVVAFVGDGAFGKLGADLDVLVEQGIGVLYVVLDNGGYGWLQAQLDKGGRSRFGFAGRPGGTAGGRPGVHHTVVDDKARLDKELRVAVEVCAAGRVAVVEIPVRLDDVPADLTDTEGQH
ncbi:thiamine pyrophosphate-binding protein [Planobispora takensis]|uniref:Acetolactate synthase n=1 Tax=Planobispora takensis TaxID=1367882 RepID=A0A8J3SY36_9ACTN|nr:thiamine pyrophosphate-binding protein [Planobispora takensis]GII02774.1 acetolactate synthase [Planobispora takensis]